jgi:steroid delta-isomerase-like uncharacterized protein
MSKLASPTALISEYYARFNSGNRQTFLDLLTENVIHDLNQGAREIGKTTFATFLARMDRCYREQISDIHICSSADGKYASAEYIVTGTYLAQDEGLPPATGQTYNLPGGAFFEIFSGKIARVSNYYNLQDWLSQIG